MFWACAGAAVVFPLTMVHGVRLVFEGMLGRAETGAKAKLFSLAGMYAVLVKVFCDWGFFLIIKTLLGAFSCDFPCDYPADNATYVMWACANTSASDVAVLHYLEEVPCWEGVHFLYFGTACVALLLFQPLATFLYPNLQFCDPKLDIKFRPEWMIILQQSRLALAGFTMMFRTAPTAMMVSALTMYCLLLLANHSMRPCLVGWINTVRDIMFATCAWSALCSLALIHGVERWVCAAALITGLLGCLGAIGVIILRAHMARAATTGLATSDSLALSTTRGSFADSLGGSSDASEDWDSEMGWSKASSKGAQPSRGSPITAQEQEMYRADRQFRSTASAVLAGKMPASLKETHRRSLMASLDQ